MSSEREPLGATLLRRALLVFRPLVEWWGEVASPFAAPITRPVARVLAWGTALGWGIMLAAAAAAITAERFHWREMSTAAAVGAVLVLLCAGFLMGRTAYDARLDLGRTRVVVGERAVGALKLVNPGRRALLASRVELPVGKGVAVFAIPRLAGGAEHEELFAIPTHRRAILAVGPIRAVRGDPLGVLARVVTWSRAVDLFVHPRTVPMDGSSSGFLQDLEGLPTKDLSSSDISFHALREYRPGDDRRHIHWKSTAKTGSLMIRQYEETRRSHLAIALSMNRAEFHSQDELELGVSVAGSLGLQALKEDRQLSVMVQGTSLPTRAGKPFLDSLSGLDFTEPRKGSVVELALAMSATVPDASVVVLLCGSFVTPQEVRRAASHVASGVKVVAVYCTPGAVVTRRTIGDTIVMTLGSLDDLAAAMRRVIG